MSFIKETSVICTSFLWSILTKDKQNQLLDCFPTSPDSDLNSIPNGPEIVDTISKLAKTFRQRYYEVYDKFELESLFKKEDGDFLNVQEVYTSVVHQLFEKTNWGRIIAMFVFLQDVAVFLLNEQRPEMVVELIHRTSAICNSSPINSWLKSHNGWRGLLELDDQTLDQNVHSFSWFPHDFSVAKGAIGALSLVALLGFVASMH